MLQGQERNASRRQDCQVRMHDGYCTWPRLEIPPPRAVYRPCTPGECFDYDAPACLAGAPLLAYVPEDMLQGRYDQLLLGMVPTRFVKLVDTAEEACVRVALAKADLRLHDSVELVLGGGRT